MSADYAFVIAVVLGFLLVAALLGGIVFVITLSQRPGAPARSKFSDMARFKDSPDDAISVAPTPESKPTPPIAGHRQWGTIIFRYCPDCAELNFRFVHHCRHCHSDLRAAPNVKSVSDPKSISGAARLFPATKSTKRAP